MATSDRTPEGKVVLIRASTGERFERWPVDAREMLATGEYTQGQPDPAPPPAVLGIPQLPKEIAPGVPAVYTHARDAAPAVPFQMPTGRTKGKRNR